MVPKDAPGLSFGKKEKKVVECVKVVFLIKIDGMEFTTYKSCCI